MVPEAGEVHLSAAARSGLSLVWKIVLGAYRDRYREGIPRRSIADEEIDARILYRVLAGGGGRELVGPAQARGGGFGRMAAFTLVSDEPSARAAVIRRQSRLS
jgi:hypothetical protein